MSRMGALRHASLVCILMIACLVGRVLSTFFDMLERVCSFMQTVLISIAGSYHWHL